jgi:hypothetical protein
MDQTPAPSPRIGRSRRVEGLVAGQATTDGAGVKLTRVLSHSLQRRLDPFLMLDAFGSDKPEDYIAGFPDHPHRGFETVTYMLSGRMLHRDSSGGEGLLEAGGVQWMTAGRGVIHSEIPQQKDGVMEGFQLWLNLPASEKMRTPWYRDFSASDLPSFTTENGVSAVVIAGASHGVEGAVVRDRTRPLFLDVHLPAGASFSQDLDPEMNAFVYVYRGAVSIDGVRAPCARMAVLETSPEADGVVVTAIEPSRLILLAGYPLREPIVQLGPFVMTSEADVRQAVVDFRSGRLTA